MALSNTIVHTVTGPISNQEVGDTARAYKKIAVQTTVGTAGDIYDLSAADSSISEVLGVGTEVLDNRAATASELVTYGASTSVITFPAAGTYYGEVTYLSE